MQNIVEEKKNICSNSTHESCVFCTFSAVFVFKTSPHPEPHNEKAQREYPAAAFSLIADIYHRIFGPPARHSSSIAANAQPRLESNQPITVQDSSAA